MDADRRFILWMLVRLALQRAPSLVRVASTAALCAVVALLVWGAVWQQPRVDPFHPTSLWAWLFDPQPHRAYDEMPVAPAGWRGFLPRDLCSSLVGCGFPKTEFDQNAAVNRSFHDVPSKKLFRTSFAGNSVEVLAADNKWRALKMPEPPVDVSRSSRLQTIDFRASRTQGGKEATESEPVRSAIFAHDGAAIVAGSSAGTIKIIKANGETVAEWSTANRSAVVSLAVPARGETVVTGADKVEIWDFQGKKRGQISPARYRTAVSRDGGVIASDAGDGRVGLWSSLSSRATIRFLETGASPAFADIDGVAVSDGGDLIAATNRQGELHVWRLSGAKVLTHRDAQTRTSAIAFAPGGLLLTGSGDGTLQVRGRDGNWENRETLASIGQLITALAVNPDGRLIAVGASDGNIRVLENGAPLHLFGGDSKSVLSLSFSADSRALVSTSLDSSFIRQWNIVSGLNVDSFAISAIGSSGKGGPFWAVGGDGYAAASMDGVDWDRWLKIGSARLIDVVGVGPETAIALSDKNDLLTLKLSDFQQGAPSFRAITGRQERRHIDAAGSHDIHAISFANEKEGYAVGDAGLILRTKDAGISWEKLHEKPGLALAAIHIEDSKVGWAAGLDAANRVVVVAANNAELGAAAAGGWRELPYYVARWFFLLGVPGLLLLILWNIRVWRREPQPPQESIEELATSDQPLTWNDPDARILKPLARGVSKFLRNVNTKPPLTLAITGRWGSGKSSLMSLLMADLRKYGGRAVWFNAWHHREEEHLLAALFAAIRREAPPEWWSWSGVLFRVRLFWMRTRRPLTHLAYLTLFVAISLVTLHLALPTFRAEEIGRFARDHAAFIGKEHLETWQALLGVILAGSGGAALLGLWLHGKLAALPANPAKLVAAITKRATLGDFSDKLTFRYRFGEQFRDVCNGLLTRRSPGVIILIDDLDRCQPEDVLKILEAINYLVSAGPCTIVLGMDRRQVEYCVGLGFEKLVEGLPDEELVYAGDETADKSGKQRAFARHYLEKLINIEVPVPPLDDAATDALLTRGSRGAEWLDEGPRWLDFAKASLSRTFEVARVGLLAFVAGMFLTWGAERLREPGADRPPPPATASTQSTETAGSGASPAAVPTSQTAAATQREQKAPTSVQPIQAVQVEVKPRSSTREVPAARRWLWWTPTILAIGIVLLFGIAAAAHRQSQLVKDSPQFADALRAVKPLLAAINATPRAIKRYQNRMRYLAARLRPPEHDPDRLDSALHHLGRWIGRPLVPPQWFEARTRTAFSESALILLGAVELFAPKAFNSPAELFNRLEHATPGDERSNERADAWRKVKETYLAEGLQLPSVAEIARYAGFIQSNGRAPPAHTADVVPLRPSS